MRFKEGFNICEKGVHARQYKCDIAHLSTVFYPDFSRHGKFPECVAMQDFDMDLFRANLARLMDMHGIKRKPLAAAAGLGETSIRDIFDEKRHDVRVGTVLRLAEYFGVSIDELVGRAPDGGQDAYTALASLPENARRQAGALLLAFAESHDTFNAFPPKTDGDK